MKSAITEPLAASIAQSREGFRGLVEVHQSRVYSIAFRILGDRFTAEEVAQDVFLALYRHLDSLESEEHLLAWLRRVTVHRATDAYRRRACRLDFAADEFCEDHMILHDSGSAVSESNAESAFTTARIEQMVAMLPSSQRAILLLRYQEDMLPTEIAALLSMPLGTVKSHLQRALKQLRNKAERPQKEVIHG